MKKTFQLLILFLIILGLVILILNKTSQASNNNSTFQITTSFYPMYFFASEIGGNKLNVTNITPPGAEPHDYDLTPQNIIQIQQSKLLILNGNVEPWANKISENLTNKNTQILVAGQNLTTNKIEENGVQVIDPHVWLSPSLAKIESEKIAESIISIDPINSDYYRANLNKLENELDQINKNYLLGLKNCETRNFVTSHAAFGYLAKDYSLTQIAINGLSPDEEPSLQELAKITNFIKTNNIKYVFFESLVSPKLSETLANETGTKTLVLDPIEGVTKENTNYLTLMNNNLQNLKVALNCK